MLVMIVSVGGIGDRVEKGEEKRVWEPCFGEFRSRVSLRFSVYLSEDVSATTDAPSGDLSKESDFSKDKIASRFSPNRKSLLHPTIFQISMKSL